MKNEIKQNNKIKLNTDIILGAFLSAIVFVIAYVSLGFAKYGISIPFAYGGGDDFSGIVNTKLIGETGWFWYNDKIGAPFGANAFDFSANMLLNFDMLVIKIISVFVKDPISVNNLRYILIFPMCTVSAFYVLRTLKINRVFSSFGSVIFSLTPYIFYRNVAHFSLSTCYFVPLSILLCLWSSEQDNSYCRINKDFFKNKKNILTILFTLLIANNGIGYYAFFTCFFLCVAAICNLFSEKKLSSVIAPAVNIVLIVVFSALALLPSLIYNAANGSNSSAVIRGVADGELYSLKIAQLFIPLDSHGIELLRKLIDGYNSHMPLVNENQGAYLGIMGIIGFLTSLVLLIKKDYKKSEYDLFVLSRMNICAVVFATVGGFCSLMSIVFRMLRGFNRISIFIMFISLTVLCIVLQNIAKDYLETKKKIIKYSMSGIALVIAVVSVLELIPTYGSHDNAFEYYNEQYQSDKKFVEQIELTLGENSMVYQLPYHATPEAGPQNNMCDYHLYAGYINSKTLSWSYGVTKGRRGDTWHRYISNLPMETMLEKICTAGFTGLYIDNRAYTEDELTALHEKLRAILGTDCIFSENRNLSFFDLRSYIQEHNITVDPSVTEEVEDSTMIFGHRQLFYQGESEDNTDYTTLRPGTIQFGPYCSLTRGTYIVKIFGNNLDAAEFDVMCGGGTDAVNIVNFTSGENEVSYLISVDNTDSVEFRTFNNSDEDIDISYIEVSAG